MEIETKILVRLGCIIDIITKCNIGSIYPKEIKTMLEARVVGEILELVNISERFSGVLVNECEVANIPVRRGDIIVNTSIRFRNTTDMFGFLDQIKKMKG